jgi:hypothetical protein
MIIKKYLTSKLFCLQPRYFTSDTPSSNSKTASACWSEFRYRMRTRFAVCQDHLPRSTCFPLKTKQTINKRGLPRIEYANKSDSVSLLRSIKVSFNISYVTLVVSNLNILASTVFFTNI